MKKISVIGLGKLGACYAAFYASKGYSVIGFDINPRNVKLISAGKAPVNEPGLSELIKKNSERISATSDIGEAISKSDISFIVLPTPSKKNGLFSVDYILSAAKEIGPHIEKKNGYHVVVLVSTVLPEDSRKYIIPAFEKYSKKKVGHGFGYVYSPSLIAIGDTLRNLENPDFLFLGSHDDLSKQVVSSIYRNIYKEKPIEHMSIESTELAKISLNSYVTMKITFANMLGDLCDRLPYADVDEITNAIGKDRRIGSNYFRSGLGYGGPCFPRDNYAFAGMAKKRGIKTPLAGATHKLNDNVWRKILSVIKKESSSKKSPVSILGISYKPNTLLSEESQAFFIAEALVKEKRNVIIFEPLGHHEAENIFGNKIKYAETFADAIKKGEVIFISNPDKLFKEIPKILSGLKAKKTIIDPWGMFVKKDFKSNVTYVSTGRKK
mgnify:CR=1 FL=1